MAAIEQIIQIAANERSASSAQSTADAAATAASAAQSTADTASTNASTALTNAAAAQTTANAAVPHTAITAGSGSGLTISGSGNSRTYAFNRPTAFNLSDVQTYANATARNAATNIQWHRGDIAIVTASETRPGETTFTDTNFDVSGFSGPGVRVFNAWDVGNDQPVSNLGFGNGDTVRFRNSGGDIVGTTTPGGNGDFTVSNIRRIAGTAHILFDITPALGPFNPALDVGSSILAETTGSPVTVPSGTYVFTADMDQPSAAATTDADWTILSVPAGTASNADLATFALDGASATRLDALTYNSTTDVLTVNGTTIELATTTPALPTITRNHYQYIGTTINIEGIGSGGTDGNQTITIPLGTTNWANRFGGTAVPTTAWPQTASLFVDGLKIPYGTVAQGGEWVFNTARSTITLTITQAQRRELPAGTMEPIDLEVETIVLTQ